MICSWCNQPQKEGEIFVNGYHWACRFFEKAFAIIHKNSWNPPPAKLIRDVTEALEVLEAERILTQKKP